MAVAKSYEHMQIISDPFVPEGRKALYVKATEPCPRCGGTGIWSCGPYGGSCFKCNGSGKIVMTIRWYTDEERAKMDAENEKRRQASEEKRLAAERLKKGPEANAFKDGVTWIITGETYSIKSELKEAGAKYTPGLNWHFASFEDIPPQYQERAQAISWIDASDENGLIKSTDELKALTMPKEEEIPSNSEFQGSIGERLRGLHLKVTRLWATDNYAMHTMEDAEGNVYLWTTSSRCMEEGTILDLDATVKDFSEYKSVKQTVLTRPRIKKMEEKTHD